MLFGQRTPTFPCCSYENVKREELFSLISQVLKMEGSYEVICDFSHQNAIYFSDCGNVGEKC